MIMSITKHNNSDIKYDEYGGILNPYKDKEEEKNLPKKKRKYNFLEKFLIRFAGAKYGVLDKNGKYNSRKRQSPRVLRIGPTNRCTARCSYCPREHIYGRASGYMDFEMYEKIIDWAKNNKVELVSFAIFGEPFLHPRILDMIDLAHQAGLKIRISSNAIIMKPEIIDKVLNYPIDAIETSMDGWTKEEYQKGKQVNAFEMAKSNIIYLLDKAKEKKVKTSFNVHFVDVGNISFWHKIKYIRFWKSKLKGLNYVTTFSYEPHNWAGTRNDLRAKMTWFNRLLAKVELKKPCPYINGVNIDWNGDAYICCNNPRPSAIIGNIQKQSIGEIYRGKEREKYLDAHEKGDFSNLDCAMCDVNSVFPLMFIKKRIMNAFISLFV